jgi:hypothetical protein
MVSRHYEIDGEAYPRVTSICAIVANDFLAYWRGRVGNAEADRVSREATSLGTKAHAAIEQFVKQKTCVCAARCDTQPCNGFLASMTTDIRPIVQAYIDWHHEHVRAIVACEKLVVSRLNKFAGTADIVAVLDDDTQPADYQLLARDDGADMLVVPVDVRLHDGSYVRGHARQEPVARLGVAASSAHTGLLLDELLNRRVRFCAERCGLA